MRRYSKSFYLTCLFATFFSISLFINCGPPECLEEGGTNCGIPDGTTLVDGKTVKDGGTVSKDAKGSEGKKPGDEDSEYDEDLGDASEVNPEEDGGERESCEGGIGPDCEPPLPPGPSGLPPGTTDFTPETPLKDGKHETKATAKFDAGPLGKVILKGVMKQGGKGQPLTYCFSGPVVLQGAPFTLNANIQICKDERGVITKKLTGQLKIDGETSAVQGTFTSGPGSYVRLVAGNLALLKVTTKGANLLWRRGNTYVQISEAGFELNYLAQKIPAKLAGKLYPGKDSSLDIQIANPKAVWTVGNVVGAKAQTATGKRIRKSSKYSTTLTLISKAQDLQSLKADWGVDATREDGKKWALKLKAANSAVAPFTGLSLEGTFNEGGTSACTAGTTNKSVPGAKTPVAVKVCWSKGKVSVAPLFETQVDVSGVGKIDFSGQYDANGNGGKGELCLTGKTKATGGKWLPIKGATILSLASASCYENQAFTSALLRLYFSIGKASATNPVLKSDVALDKSNGMCVAAPKSDTDCTKLNTTWKRTVLEPNKKFHARYTWFSGACIDTHTTTEASCKTAGHGWQSGTNIRHRVSLAAFCQKSGSSTCAWSSTCNTKAGDKSCAQPWKPFTNMPIGAPYDIRTAVFGKVLGSIWVRGSNAFMEFKGQVTSTLKDGKARLINHTSNSLFNIKQPGIRSRVGTDGKWNNTILGQADINLTGVSMASLKVPAMLEGKVEKDQLTFSGVLLPKNCNSATKSCEWPTHDPFAKVIGSGVFEVGGKDGTIDANAPYSTNKTSHFDVDIILVSSVKLPGNTKTTVETQMRGRWLRDTKGVLATVPVVTFAAPVAKQKLTAGKFTLELGKGKDKLGKFVYQPIVILASSGEAKDFYIDLDGKDSNGRETNWTVPSGLTIRSTALLPHVGDIFDNPTARVDISYAKSKFKLLGEIKFNWELIKPAYGVPTVHSMTMDSVFVSFEFPGTTRIKLGGKVNLVTLDRQKNKNNLQGLMQFEKDSTGAVGGTIALSGLWRNPFWIPNVAVFNAGISMKMNPAVPIFPSALGFTGQGLVLKGKLDAPWPKIAADKFNNPVGVNKDGTHMKQLPSNVFTAGLTFYYDVEPWESSLCLYWCKIPPLLFRMDIQNLSTDDMINFTNTLLGGIKTLVDEAKTIQIYDRKTKKMVEKKAPWAPLLKVLPLGKALKPVSMKPFQMTLKRFQVYFSTHDHEVFNVQWPLGFKLKADANFTPPAGPDKGKVKQVSLRGHMDIWGMTLRGRMSAIQLLPGLRLTGNPYRRYAKTYPGYLRIPTSRGHWNWGTFEGWFRDGTVTAGSGAAVLIERMTRTSGFRIATDEMAPACVPGTIDLDGRKLDCKTPHGRVVVTLKTNSSSIPSSHRTRIIKTKYGVIFPNSVSHIAVTRDPKTHDVQIYVNGIKQTILDTSYGKDGERGTSDDLKRFGLPDVTASMSIGKNFTYVDDIRLWASVRTQGELERSTYRLPKGFHTDTKLIARWEMDFDRSLDKNSSGVILRNSRLGVDSKLNGNYVSGAKNTIDPNNQDLHFTLAYPILNIFHSGWAIRAGLDLKLPGPILKAIGNPNGITVGADLSYLPGAIGGRLYARELTFLPIPTLGGFVLTGDGPNNKTGDFDDGFYVEGQFKTPKSFKGEDLPFIDASGGIALDWKSKRHPIVTASVRMGCLVKNSKGEGVFTSKECSLTNGYHFWSKALLGKKGGLLVDLGGGFGKLGINGIFSASTLDAPFNMLVDGGLKVFGREIVGAKMTIDGKSIKANAGLDLGSHHGVNLGTATKLAVQFDWKPVRFCAKGYTDVRVPVVATVKANVDICLGTSPKASFTGTAKAGKLGGVTLADMSVRLSSSRGLEITKSKISLGPLSGNLTGWFKSSSNFSGTGTARWKMGSHTRTWYTEVVKEVAKKLSGWSCSSFCKKRTGGVCVLRWFRCKKNEKKTQNYNVEANVSLTVASSKISAKASLVVGYWKGSSSTTCSGGSKPRCCFKFVSPIGSKCINLY